MLLCYVGITLVRNIFSMILLFPTVCFPHPS